VSKPFSCVFFISSLLLVVGCYWPGLHGGFLFDDYPNLSDLGAQGGVVDLATLKYFVLNGWSGPTGRPLALLSFLLDDNTWPSIAWGFKVTNLKIHLLCGISLCWLGLLVMRAYGWSEQRAIWVGLLTGTVWLLHPFLVSTTLYIVQRMALLSTFFILIGSIGYLKGRLLLGAPGKSRLAYCVMSLSIGSGTALSLLCKENGALLPMLLLITELLVLRRAPVARVGTYWLTLFLAAPACAVLGYLAWSIDLSANPWPTRGFNQIERVLTESRILWDYIFSLLLPRVEGDGLFQDGIVISKNLFDPWTTASSLLGILLVLVGAVYWRKKWPLLALAITYFFAAHLIESTVIGLELYFEHRNYLASLFVFLPFSAFVVWLFCERSKFFAGCLAFVVIATLAWMTWERAKLWSDPDRLELFWAAGSPASPRAQNAIATYLLNQGRAEDALAHIQSASAVLPNSSLLTIRLLLMKVDTNAATQEDFLYAAKKLSRQPFDAQTVSGLRLLVERLAVSRSTFGYHADMLQLLQQLEQDGPYSQMPLFLRLSAYLQAQIYLSSGSPEKALKFYRLAMQRYNEIDASMAMVAEMATARNYDYALIMLQQAEDILEKTPDHRLKRERLFYLSEISRIRSAIEHDQSR